MARPRLGKALLAAAVLSCILATANAGGSSQCNGNQACNNCYNAINNCNANYTTPSLCARTGRFYQPPTCSSSYQLSCCRTGSGTLDCCQPIPNPPAVCNVPSSTSSCCTALQTICNNTGQAYVSQRVGPNQYNSSCIPVGSAPRCPTNYAINTFSDPGQWGVQNHLCVAANCLTTAAHDCTRCLTCRDGHEFVADGSCQPRPSISGGILSTLEGISADPSRTDMCASSVVFNTTTANGLNRTSFVLNVQAEAPGLLTGMGTPLTFTYRCFANNTLLFTATSGRTEFAYTAALGTTVINCSVTDANGLSASCLKTVTVVDNQPPILPCTPRTVGTGPGRNFAVVNWSTIPDATDNVQILSRLCARSNGQGTTFSVNTATAINCWAWDGTFNSTCSYNITIIDDAAPSIVCPASSTVVTVAGQNYGRHSFAVLATDNVQAFVACNASTVTNFAAGLTIVSCVASDGRNTNSCTFNVTVLDVELPQIACPVQLELGTSPNIPTSITATGLVAINASDNVFLQSVVCTPFIPILTSTSPGRSLSATATISTTFPLGPTPITCTAFDRQGNNRSCSTAVVVRDATPPVIACSHHLLSTQPSVNFSFLATGYTVSASDNVDTSPNITCTPSYSPTRPYPFGDTEVTCVALDAAGNTAACALTVSVVDHQPPVVQCPSATITVPTSLLSNIPVTIPQLNATDNVRVLNTSLSIIENQLPVTARVLPGNTTQIIVQQQWPALLTFTATDTSGNTASCSFGVSVFSSGEAADNIPPVILNCPSGSSLSTVPPSDFNSPLLSGTKLYNLTTLPGSRFNTLSWPTLNATDNSGFVVAGYLEWSPNPSTAASGLSANDYVVAYGATDRRGNSAYCAFRIRVTDIEPPTWLRCSADQMYDSGNSVGAFASSWPQGGIYAIDNVGVPVPEGSCTSVPVGYCPQTPGQPPAIMFPVGTVQFTYTAVDSSGNQAVPCRFNVTVRDTGRPVIPGCSIFDPPKFITAPTNPGSSRADISRLCPLLQPTDNIGVTSLTYTSSPDAGFNCSTLIPFGGITIITAVARDASGLASEGCNIVVLVSDSEPPTLSGCSPTALTTLLVNTTPGLSTGVVQLPPINATDNVAVTELTSSPAGYVGGQTYTFPNRLTSLSFTARDSANQVTCVVNVFVNDTEVPVIHNFPGPAGSSFYTVNLSTDPGQPTALYTVPALYATDNVEVASSGFDLLGYTGGETRAFPIGVTTLRFAAADSNLNRASVTLVISVVDTEKPVFFGCPSVNSSDPMTLEFNTSLGQATRQVSWNISVADNSQRRLLTTQTSRPIGYSKDSLFPIGTVRMTFESYDASWNLAQCVFFVTVVDREPPTVLCPDSFSSVIGADDFGGYIMWPEPYASDNSNQVSLLDRSLAPGNYSVGKYNVTYVVADPSGNNASCTFSFTVSRSQSPISTASASIGAAIAGGAGGGIALLALLAVVVLVVMRRKHEKKMRAASSGYAELLAMSDEFVLERARAIQQALVDQRAAEPPAAVNAQFIHPTRKFAAPPTTLKELEEYIRETVRKELSRDSLEFGPELGAGEFGAVYRGEHSSTDVETGLPTKQTVAIKMLKNSTKDEDKVRFLKEAAIMAQFSHPNIVGLVGVCTLPPTEPTLIVLEYMHLGSLQGYLQSPMVKDQLETLTMLRMALEVGSAMQYLAEAGFVHRDLAARNVLLDENMNCRVGDFGLSVDLAASDEGEGGIYSGDEGAKIPVRWTAIEALTFRQFSTASDVWSFGVLLWEIWSYGEIPYKGWSNKRVTEQVCEGYRLEKPSRCPDEVYRVMIDCWNKNVKRRATFAAANRALVQIWKDTAVEAHPAEAAQGNLYDVGEDDATNTDTIVFPKKQAAGAGTALYDMASEGQPAAGKRGVAGMALYDTGDEDGVDAPRAMTMQGKKKPLGSTSSMLPLVGGSDGNGSEGPSSRRGTLTLQVIKGFTPALYDVANDTSCDAEPAAAAPHRVLYDIAGTQVGAKRDGGYLALSAADEHGFGASTDETEPIALENCDSSLQI